MGVAVTNKQFSQRDRESISDSDSDAVISLKSKHLSQIWRQKVSEKGIQFKDFAVIP